MNVLFDSHAVLWAIANDSRFPDLSRKLAERNDVTSYVSIASLWEISIKHSAGRLELKNGLQETFTIIGSSRFKLLPVWSEHILTLSALPPIHNDPFDRILIAQAKTEGLTLVTKDQRFSKYDVNLFWD